jgi:hypothetical protein
MRGLIAFAGLCLFAASAVAGARPVVFTAPVQGEALQSGTVVEVSWTRVPSNADEVELLLSLDGGGRIALRLTEQLSSRDRSYLWHVPNLSSPRAAFVLRMGIEGREIESAPSAPFEILPEPSRPVEPVDWRAGELWLGEEGRARDADPMPAAGLDSRPERWAPLHERNYSIAPAGAALPGARPSARRIWIQRDPSVNAPRGPLALAPFLGPLRI